MTRCSPLLVAQEVHVEILVRDLTKNKRDIIQGWEGARVHCWLERDLPSKLKTNTHSFCLGNLMFEHLAHKDKGIYI